MNGTRDRLWWLRLSNRRLFVAAAAAVSCIVTDRSSTTASVNPTTTLYQQRSSNVSALPGETRIQRAVSVMLVHGQSSEPATVPLDGPGRTLSLVGSGRIVSKFHYADPTGPGPRASWLSDKSADSGRRLVRSMSTCTDFVRGSGRVGSQTKSVGPCSGN